MARIEHMELRFIRKLKLVTDTDLSHSIRIESQEGPVQGETVGYWHPQTGLRIEERAYTTEELEALSTACLRKWDAHLVEVDKQTSTYPPPSEK